jgi:hypothetical protein
LEGGKHLLEDMVLATSNKQTCMELSL